MISIQQLSDDEQRTLNRLLEKIENKSSRNQLRSRYFDGKQVLQDMGISIPPALRRIETVVGWPAKGVGALSKRCNLDGFVIPGSNADDLGITQMWTDNNMDVEAPQAHTSAFIHATAFIATTLGDTQSGEPEVLITCRDALTGTGTWDPRRRILKDVLSIVEVDEGNQPVYMIMYLDDRVVTMEKQSGGRWTVDRRTHSLGRPPVELLVYRPRLGRPFGSSRITRAAMSVTDSAVRTILRSEVSAEFYSAPQRYALGVEQSDFVDSEGNPKTGWETLLGRVWSIGRDEEGSLPEVGQFPQMTMQPHTDQLKGWAQLFAAEMDLPVSSLGIVQDNPASAEAIYAAKEELITEAESANDVFGASWRRAVLTGFQLREGLTEVPASVSALRAKWRDPATPSKSAAADAVVKQVQVGVLPPDSEVTYEQLGYDATTISRLVSEKRRNAGRGVLQGLAAAAQTARQNPAVADLASRGDAS